MTLNEKLGSFYLGRLYDPVARSPLEAPVYYDARDLTTHAVCVGMTGSGKTGLGIGLMEEAAIDRIPIIAIDPKGDLGNMLLTFPDLAAADFQPWIDEGEAARKGMTPDEFAGSTAKLWKEGLSSWGQDGDRIRRFMESVDRVIYTPGSTSGVPISVLSGFRAPGEAVRKDEEALQERISASVSGLLGLIGIDADPLQSREHILLATILDHHWRDGIDLDIAKLIAAVQEPSVTKVGVLDLESFFPADDRTKLALRLNNLLASPGFSAWTEGEPLDIQRLLWREDGTPRIAIMSIAHLTDAERMFFVTLLLNEIIAWMRSQSGTTSLRALVYMDEIFGYFPPSAKPPSKIPMLTLLKQARAFGIGITLATQNPVDLDYKGLSNTGTWFLGRLQTERDKMRVMDGLESAGGGGMNRQEMDRILSGLDSRVFLMHNVHEDAPVLMHTRWALSYLRGPLTRQQIQKLMAERPEKKQESGETDETEKKTSLPDAAKGESARPLLPPGIEERIVAGPANGGYSPALVATADLHYVRSRLDLDEWRRVTVTAPLRGKIPPDIWSDSRMEAGEPPAYTENPEPGAGFGPLPAPARREKSYQTWQKRLRTHLYRAATVTMWKAPSLKMVSKPAETEGEFRIRVREAARAARDEEIEKLRKRYAPKVARLEIRIRNAKQKIEEEASQFEQARKQSVISIGATVLGALLGRKTLSSSNVGRATTSFRGAARARDQKGDVSRAREDLAALEEQLEKLQNEAEAAIAALESGNAEVEIEPEEVSPRKSDIAVQELVLAWLPEPAP